jgi:membrane-associated phospholipid phosphatase
MKKILLFISLLISFSLSAQVFNVNKKVFLLTISTALAADLSNNYADRKLIEKPSISDLAKLDKDNVAFFDQIAFQSYSKKLKDFSDYTAYFTLGTAAWFAFDEQYWLDNLMIYSEVMIVQSAIAKWTKTLTHRYRPFVYDDDVSSAKKQQRNSQHSFYSMHSSTVFAAATFGYYYYSQLYGRNLPLALALYVPAATTAVLRVASANHFPSDVVVGALAGSCISYFICKMHRSDKVFINFGLSSLNLEYRF